MREKSDERLTAGTSSRLGLKLMLEYFISFCIEKNLAVNSFIVLRLVLNNAAF